MRLSLVRSVAVLFLAVACVPELGAQAPGWTSSIAVSQSLDSRSATQPDQPCGVFCFRRDVLSPVSVTTVEVELSKAIRGEGSVGIDYHVRLTPAAFVRGNPASSATWTGTGWQMPLDTERSSTFGAGVEPLGFTLWLGSPEARFEVDASLGIIAFLDPFLARNATRANAIYDWGFGAQLSALRLGYRRRHISNAGTGEVNPGLDANVFFVGWVF